MKSFLKVGNRSNITKSNESSDRAEWDRFIQPKIRNSVGWSPSNYCPKRRRRMKYLGDGELDRAKPMFGEIIKSA